MNFATINRFIKISFLIGLLSVILVYFISIFQASEIRHTSEMLVRTKNVMFGVRSILVYSMDIQNGARAYVIAGDKKFIRNVTVGLDSIQYYRQQLRRFIGEDSVQKRLFDSLSFYVDQRIDRATRVVRFEENNMHDSAVAIISTGLGTLVTERIRDIALEIEADEMSRLVSQKKVVFKTIFSANNILYAILILTLIISYFLHARVSRGLRIQKKKEDRFRSLLEAAPDAMIISDEQGFITMVNWRAAQIFGYTAAEMIGKKIELLVPEGMQQQHASLREHYQELGRDHLKDGGRELQGQRKDGSVFMTEITLAPIQTDEGKMVSASIRDITARIKARDHLARISNERNYLASIVEQSAEAIISRDLEGKFITWNKGAEALFGYTESEVLGKMPAEFRFVDLTPAEIEEIVQEVMRVGTWRKEFKYHRKDGTSFYGDTVANLLRDSTGEPLAMVIFVIDISLRRQLELKLKKSNEELEEKVRIRTEEIRKSETQYRYLFHNNPLPMWILEMGSFRFLDVNEMAIQKYGYSREEFLTMSADLIRPEYSREAFRRDNNPAAANLNDGYRGVWQHQKKDGSLIWVEIIAHTIQYEGKKARLILANDVTERKRSEEKLVASEKRFRAMIEYNNDMIAMMNAEGVPIYRSPSARRLTGMGDDQAANLNFFDDIVHPEDRERMIQVYKTVLESPAKPVKTHYRGKLQNGNYMQVEGTLTNLLDEPAVNAVVFNFRDVTLEKKAADKLKEQQAQIQTLSNNLPGVMIFQLEGDLTGYRKFIYVSSEVTRVTGKTPAEVLKDPSILYDMIDEEDKPAFQEQERNSYEKGKAFQMEVRIRNYRNEIRWLQICSFPRYLSDGRLVWDGFHVDITERKMIEQKINNLNAELEELVKVRTHQLQRTNEELEAFTYSVSHDLRAPLRAIIGFASILKEEYTSQLDQEAQRITDVIQSSTLRMGKLIDDLLAFSRLGRHEIDRVWFDTEELINQVIANLLPADNSAPPIQWKVGKLHRSYGDVSILRQVWMNLLGNAVKYSRKNEEPVIEINSVETEKETIFSVKDNGVGFDQKYADKLFKVFQRLHTQEEFEGTGVGLAIVEKVILKHSGRVWAEGEVGKGSCFYFSLPKTES